MKPNIKELHKIYIDTLQKSKDFRNISEDELLDMDFFLNEDDLFAGKT